MQRTARPTNSQRSAWKSELPCRPEIRAMTNFVSFPAVRLVLSPKDARVATSTALCYSDLVKSITAKVSDVSDHMGDIDRKLLRENLRLTPAQRLEKFAGFMRFTSELRRAGKRVRRSANPKPK